MIRGLVAAWRAAAAAAVLVYGEHRAAWAAGPHVCELVEPDGVTPGGCHLPGLHDEVTVAPYEPPDDGSLQHNGHYGVDESGQYDRHEWGCAW